ncbi:UB2Q1 enzyme, partial [Polypterus senegalus]|nr:UB2Q1 enzyme [Polypterus senegalus]
MSGGSLRRELRLLESIFDQTHERLRIISARVDELTCEFITEAGGTVRVHCNITESYPNVPPIWFVDSDDPSLASVLERLADIKKGNTLGRPLNPIRDGDRGFQLFPTNEKFPVCADHTLTLITSLPFVKPPMVG